MRYILYADGGSRGNPGPAGSGALVRDEEGTVLLTVSEFLGTTTNNVAEYTGVILALERLAPLLGVAAAGAAIDVRMDSQLVVKQMRGEYKIKHPNLIPLAARLTQAQAPFKQVTFTHVYREENKEADALANQAMDKGQGKH